MTKREARRERAKKRRERRRSRSARRRTRRAGRQGAALHALTSSALALPGLASTAGAEAPSDRFRADYNYSFYSEDELDNSDVAGGDNERYEIHMHQWHLAAPVGDRVDVGLDVAYETMSGASPWYVVPDTDGDPIQVMTGATIDDTRVDALLSTNYYLSRGKVGGSAGVSIEEDYLSFNGGFAGNLNFNEENTTLSGGAGFSIDRIQPVDADQFPLRPDDENKQTYSVFTGISQIVGEQTVVQSNLSFQHARDFLSDPYKQVFVDGNILADTRPDQRNQFAWLSRLRHHFRAINATTHLDYRFYVDDWNILSHTFEFAWYQSFWDRLRLIPSLRYYSQSSADFYAPYFTSAGDDHFSSDYRLSPYGAISGRIRAEVPFTIWRIDMLLSGSYERYVSSADYALGDVEVENPGLVSFDLFSVGLTTRF